MGQGSIYYDRVRLRFYLFLYMAFFLGVLLGVLLLRQEPGETGAIGISFAQLSGLLCSRGLVSLLLLSFLPLFFVTFLSFAWPGSWMLPGCYGVLGLLDSRILSWGLCTFGRGGALRLLLILLPGLLLQLFLYPALIFRIRYGDVSLRGVSAPALLILILALSVLSVLCQALLLPLILQSSLFL